MIPVSILLSAWNGAAFLPDQLASFDAQTHRPWTLRWRDDGSTDGTRALLDSSAGRPLADDGRHLGIVGSFTALLRAHVGEERDDPVAFADQDDVWLPEKLARAVDALRSTTPGRPALYCAPQMLVDRHLRTIEPSAPLRRPPGFPDALAQNVATGCTVVLNAPAKRLLATVDPPQGTMHDWWAYLVVSACGGAVLIDRVPTVLYRQHGANALGARRSRLRRAAGALHRGPGAFMALFRAHVAALRRAGTILSPDARATLDRIECGLAGGPLARLALLRELRIGRQTALETALLRAWVALG